MNELFLYNPENDIALAANPVGSFTAPRQAALLARFGAPLMWWMGDKGDYVLLPPPASEADYDRLSRWCRMVTARYGEGPAFVYNCNGLQVSQLSPWGWSRATVHTFEQVGVSNDLLKEIPVDRLRDMSHRRTSMLVNSSLSDILKGAWENMICVEGACEAFSVSDVSAIVSRFGCGEVYVKAPWSSSGRGVVSSRSLSAEKLLTRCEGVIRRQGSVLIERAHKKVLDFAMLFEADAAGTVRFYGMSGFFNGRDVAYSGNIVASDNDILGEICRYLPMELIADVRGALEIVLTRILGGTYIGYFGVDMMVVADPSVSGAFALVPCVELNLRMTMGVVAHRLFHRLASGTGIMKVIPVINGAAALPEDALPLVPYNEYFNILYYSGTSKASGSVTGV